MKKILIASLLVMMLGGCGMFKEAGVVDTAVGIVLNAIGQGQADEVYDNHCSEPFRASTTREQWKETVAIYHEKLGEFKSCDRNSFHIQTVNGKTTCEADYDVQWTKANGTVEVDMAKVDGVWKLTGLIVNSEALAVSAGG